MKNIIWKDVSSFSRNDKERKPYAFNTFVGEMYISIVFNHIYYPECWIVNCYDLNIKDTLLSSKNLEGAKVESVNLVKNRLENLLSSFK